MKMSKNFLLSLSIFLTMATLFSPWAFASVPTTSNTPAVHEGNLPASPEKFEGIDHDFGRSLHALRETFRRLKQSRNEPNRPTQMAGGWNGSGGGGGLTCFDTKEEFEAASNGRGHLRSDAISRITNFKIFDLVDTDHTPDWPHDDSSPADFIKERIRVRLGKTLPILATVLTDSFELARKSIWTPEADLEVFPDVGPSSAGHLPKENCAYVQWAFRVQDNHESLFSSPEYQIKYNKSLDDRLQEILSPREYNIQKTVLTLHESVYSHLALHGRRDSGSTRSLIDYLLSEETFHQRFLDGPHINTAFWSLWIRESLSILTYTTQTYGGTKRHSANWNSNLEEQLTSYQSFLQKLQGTLGMIGIFQRRANAPAINTIHFAHPHNPLHDDIIFNFVYFFFFIEKPTPFGLLTANDFESFYLLATRLESQRQIQSVQKMVFENRTNHPEWKKACEGVRQIHAAWMSEPTPPDFLALNMVGPRRWMAGRAVRFCSNSNL